jgi:hypothetical protein
MGRAERAASPLRGGRGDAAVDDWWFVAAVTALLLALTSLPYVYAYRSAPADREFMGILVNVPDHAQYFAWMRGLTDAHLMSNTLTPEPNPPVFFNLLWWSVGRVGRLFGLGPAGSLQVLRIVATVLFMVVVHRLCALFLADRLQRRTALLVTALTSGFGWILVVLKYTLTGGELYFPLDVFIAEGNTFYCILAQPHFVAAALYAFVFELVLRGEETGRLRWALAAGLVTFLLGWQHAYDLASIYGVLAAYGVLRVLRDRRLPRYLVRAGLVIALVSWWPGAYSTLLVGLEPSWGAVLAQFGNAGVATPPPAHLVILLGPALLLALASMVSERAWRLDRDDRTLFLHAWFLSGFVLVYLPVSWNVHLINGWQIPIAILATRFAFGSIAPAVARRVPRLDPYGLGRALAAALLFVVVPTNLYLYAWRFYDLGRHALPYYLLHDEMAALRWLDEHAAGDDVVLSALALGQYVPAFAGTRAYLGHWAQTVDYYGKQRAVRTFFDGATDDADRRAILARGGVDWVMYGDEERALGTYAPETSPFLRRDFDAGRCAVYRVVLDGGNAFD